MGAWEGGPGGLGRLPWAPGAPPRGSQGVSRLKVCGSLVAVPPWIRIKNHVDFDVDFGRLGVHLGSLLGVIFGHVGAFFGPS